MWYVYCCIIYKINYYSYNYKIKYILFYKVNFNNINIYFHIEFIYIEYKKLMYILLLI